MTYLGSMFGLCCSEVLQQEIIADDVQVSLIFSPDIETPDLVERYGNGTVWLLIYAAFFLFFFFNITVNIM
jgi:hypothetical protein